jgi:tetratricopeptide (TPR) repeat protein
MSTKKMDKTVSKALQSVVDHSLVRQTVEAARICDQAVSYGKEGKYEDALQLVFPLILQEIPILFERAKNIAIRALEDLADRSMEDHDFVQALEYLNQWLFLEPDNLSAMILKGDILLDEMDDLEGATEVFRSVLKKYPNNIDAFICLARIDIYHRRYRRAAQRLTKAWKMLIHSEWGYPRYEEIVINIFETFYKFTSLLVDVFGDKNGAKEMIIQAIEEIGGHSEYLQDCLALLQDNREGNSSDVEL